jgi:hypothetical protein
MEFILRIKSHPAFTFANQEEFMSELSVHPLYCLASRSSVQRWEVMFRCRASSQAHAQQWHVHGIDVGRKQRSTLLARAALCELLVLRLMRFGGAWRVRYPQHHATCVVSRRHFLVSKNLAPYLFDEGQRLYGSQRFSDAAKSWGKAALLQHAASHAFLSTILIDDILGDPAFKKKRNFDEMSQGGACMGLLPKPRCKQAFLLAEAGAAMGCAHSKGALARCYINGWGTPQRWDGGRRLASESAESGSCMGQFVLGQVSDWGKFNPDKAEAVKWYRLAAEQGHASAQLNLGTLLWNGGQGVLQDKAEGITWWRRASLSGLELAKASLKGRQW